MKDRWCWLAAVFALLLVAPVSASAHAYLIATSPTASQLLETPPEHVGLTFDEAVEPRFAIISVTNVDGRQETTAVPARSPANPDTLVVPLRPHLPQGWYLIYWRAISVDGHPVSGAFTYAVGPNPGPAPQFVIPKISATAVTAQLLIARWVMFLATMIGIGLFVLRTIIARPLIRRGVAAVAVLRPVTVAFVIASVVGLLAIPVYLDFSTANDSLRSVFDLGSLVPLFGVTAFGRGMLKMEICWALFCAAAYVALWVDRPDRERRSLAELMAGAGALLAAVAVMQIPGASGHAAQTSPRGLSVAVDLIHLLSGSVWLGGLVGLLILWFSFSPARMTDRVAVMRVVIPRFSAVAFVSVMLLLVTGTIATIDHMPAVNALWETGYGVAILVKIGLLAIAMGLASVNLLRNKPRLQTPTGGEAATRLLRAIMAGETIVVAGAVFAASLLSSLAPPPPAFALENSALANVGPGRVAATVQRAGYKLEVLVSPNKAAEPDSFALKITKDGALVTHADVTLTFNQLDMQMPEQEYQLKETQPGIYVRAAPALVMVGHWSLAFDIAPQGEPGFTALINDEANG